MQKLIYITFAVPGKSELDALLLAKSIRTFGGGLADCPIWVLIFTELGVLSESTQEMFARLNAIIIPFEANPEIFKFPFATKIIAAAFAEMQAQDQTERLVFMDRDTLVLQEPDEFLFSADKVLGYRPVHHKLIGSAWGEPLDAFWQLIYEVCEVPDANIFSMVTHAGERIRPYFNAGMFIIRPERGLLTQWKDVFFHCYRQAQFQAFYQKNQLYNIFIHQAIFTGVLLHNLDHQEMHELSPKVNYPLHLHSDIPNNQRPETIDDLITARYENIFDEPGWEQLPITEPLQSWLNSQPRVRKYLEGPA